MENRNEENQSDALDNTLENDRSNSTPIQWQFWRSWRSVGDQPVSKRAKQLANYLMGTEHPQARTRSKTI